MNAIRVQKFGPPEVLVLSQVPDLIPQADQIVVDIKAIGVNPVDVYIRSGQYPLELSLPYTPGFDAAGVVNSAGDDVKQFHTGDRVYVTGSVTGTYAQQTACLSHQLFPLPDEINFEQGAAIGIPYATAYRALFTKAQAVDKETVLIHGASGGVGIAAVQLAKIANLKIIGTAGTQEGLKLIREQGADEVLDHSRQGYLNQVMTMTQGRGIDIILEMLANVNLGNDLKVLAKNGRIVVIGSRGSVTIDPRDAMTRESTVLGMSLLSVTSQERLKIYTALENGLQLKKLVPVIGKRFSLSEAALAHCEIMKSGAHGKMVLIP